jgi:hypothetical protein
MAPFNREEDMSPSKTPPTLEEFRVRAAQTGQLLGNPNPSASIHAWPMQHAVLASLLWSVALVAVFAPLASYLYRRRTTD